MLNHTAETCRVYDLVQTVEKRCPQTPQDILTAPTPHYWKARGEGQSSGTSPTLQPPQPQNLSPSPSTKVTAQFKDCGLRA